MDDAYSQETLKLAEVVDRYASMDVYDAERPKLVGVSSPQTDYLRKILHRAWSVPGMQPRQTYPASPFGVGWVELDLCLTF